MLRLIACDALERMASIVNPRATVWKGPGVPTREEGIKVLGTPWPHIWSQFWQNFRLSSAVSHTEGRAVSMVVASSLRVCSCMLPDQSGPALPQLPSSQKRATGHCGNACRTFCKIDLAQCDEVVRDVATLPLSMGLRSAVRVWSPAKWASWADCLPNDASAPSTSSCRDSCRIWRHVRIRLFGGSQEGSVGLVWSDGFRTPIMARCGERSPPATPVVGTRNQEVSNEVGNMKPRRRWNVSIGRWICSQDSPRQAEL